jgi:hypothetical protein
MNSGEQLFLDRTTTGPDQNVMVGFDSVPLEYSLLGPPQPN